MDSRWHDGLGACAVGLGRTDAGYDRAFTTSIPQFGRRLRHVLINNPKTEFGKNVEQLRTG